MDANVGQARASAGRRTILLVEDDTFLRAAATDYLALAGHSVLTAANALEAVALLEENLGSVDAIFTDINMPGEMDGLELARFAKAHWPQMIVFVTTGGPHTLSQRVGGIDGFFAKPYDIAEVADAIAEHLKTEPAK